MDPITRAIKAAGSAAALARICGQPPQAVTRWKRTGLVPPKHCRKIEEATGVTRYELRPDFFGSEPANEEGIATARCPEAA